MDKQLIILPFDHRHSFLRDILGLKKNPSWRQKKQVTALKQIIFDAFLLAAKNCRQPQNLAILIDEEYGAKIIKQAQKRKIKICLPVEKSGQDEFDFNYGEKFSSHITKIRPDYVKALVRYNPLEKEKNKRQLSKLKKLSDWCRQKHYPLILELLVPPTDQDLKLAGSRKQYDQKLRGRRTIAAIKEIRKALTIALWKLEGYDDELSCRQITHAVGPREKIIILGRGENKSQVERWLKNSKPNQNVIGFAIGRTIFLKALQQYVANPKNKKQTTEIIAKNFLHFINYWENIK